MINDFSLFIDLVTVGIAAVAIIYSWKANKHAAESNKIAKKYSSLNEAHTIDDQTKEILSLHADIHHRIGNFETTKSLFIIDKEEDYEKRIEATVYLLTLVVAMEPLLNYIEKYTENSITTLDSDDEKSMIKNFDYGLINLSVLIEFSNMVIKKVEKYTDLKRKVEFTRPGLCRAANVVKEYYDNILSFDEICEKFNLEFELGKTALMVGIHGEKVPHNSNYTEQTLGPWLISEGKMDVIKYLIGIDLKSRIIVSIVQVNNPRKVIDEQGNNKVCFSKDKILFNWTDGKKIIRLNESILWNARNPIKYLN